MTLQERDNQILRLVARFRQCSSRQIATLLFHSAGSETSQRRTLDRLMSRGYIARVEHRLVGGSKGGSGQYVYQLGPRGWAQYVGGKYLARRSVDYHALAILDAFIALVELERQGVIVIRGVSTEPDCWARFEGIELKPDLYIDLELGGVRRKLWIEIDQGTEGQRQVLGKLSAVPRAFENADGDEWPEWPLTVWSAVDEARAKELRWLIQRLPKEERAFFAVTTHAQLAGAILST